MRFLTLAALVGLLAACNAGATTPSEQPLPTQGASTEPIMSASAAASAAGMSCDDAFAAVDLGSAKSSDDLTGLKDQVDTTIASCPSINDWTAALAKAAPDLPITDALAFLQQECTDPAVSASALCAPVPSGS
jgi:hypothetical protein